LNTRDIQKHVDALKKQEEDFANLWKSAIPEPTIRFTPVAGKSIKYMRRISNNHS